tara:strand:+ start:165 stop:503 length:339 start_codon:yes stop_codon:yes gene_type:complete
MNNSINISLAPKPQSFKKNSLDLLLKTQWELFVLKVRLDKARINPITDKELETAIALTGLKATVFERRLEMYEYHHGETREYWIAKYDFEGFLNDNKELMHEYRVWFENAKT